MIQFDTKASGAAQAATVAVPFEGKLRQAAMVLTLAIGVPLVLAWFGLLSWGVLWLVRIVLAL
ncbi:hypothetical protein VQ02_17150 [Methylobacterium variabile]|jgi:hypothetical protein|uniref:Uncharacterized protein n=1 Tax=Methylobacterium variabile TaxID=298794 RepID=A0A0J6V9F4_9HYPH|nr:hypothetical protein [Methylobacterium variabile]KMO35611.1 hypothetical protein VQ02_17150 [Methylobacterium variabile]